MTDSLKVSLNNFRTKAVDAYSDMSYKIAERKANNRKLAISEMLATGQIHPATGGMQTGAANLND